MEQNCQKPPVLVSACLLGENCRYNAERKACARALVLMHEFEVIPVCPEVLAGLPTPRRPSECRQGGVYMDDGTDVTFEFVAGANEVLSLAERRHARYALLKERSPSCGSGEIYDGSFTHTLVPGDGVTAALLKENGIRVFGESRIEDMIRAIKEETE